MYVGTIHLVLLFPVLQRGNPQFTPTRTLAKSPCRVLGSCAITKVPPQAEPRNAESCSTMTAWKPAFEVWVHTQKVWNAVMLWFLHSQKKLLAFLGSNHKQADELGTILLSQPRVPAVPTNDQATLQGGHDWKSAKSGPTLFIADLLWCFPGVESLLQRVQSLSRSFPSTHHGLVKKKHHRPSW